ncbi:MAG TPA: ABC transporter ATP-binding protein [Gemmatimonadales bacterium]|nr:ABC transporter ATP-binding protein [Gemmatimonadales bacterium]
MGLAFLGALVAAVMQAASLLALDPLLKQLFGSGISSGGGSLLERIIERVIGPLVAGRDQGEAMFRLVLLFLAAMLIKVIAQYGSAYASVLVQEGMARDLRTRLWRHLLRLDLGVFQRTRGGQVAAALVSDADQVKMIVVAALAAFFQNLVLIVSLLSLMSLYSWQLTLMVLALAPLLVVAVQLLRERLKRHARSFSHERGELVALITERLGAMKLIRAFGAEATEDRQLLEQANRYRKGYVRTQRFALLTSPASELFGAALVMLVIWVAANPGVMGVSLSGESTVVFVALAAQLMTPIKAIAQVPAQLAIAEGSGERVFALLDLPETEIDDPDALEATFERDLVVDGVNFGYEPERPVLSDISFRVAKGEVVALVGPSGAGKTTLLELLPRFHEPWTGEIRMDGVPISRFSRSSLRALMAVVGQETVLLHDTVRANIGYGRPGATPEQIIAAASAANADEFIRGLPEGYDTVLGERGTRLSGGQRQRIAIARALLRDAPILILDEATSALDTESERLVQEAIERLMRDRTVLVIAHRLATVRDADRIVVLQDGRLVESGRHADLHAEAGLYRRLHDLQYSAAEER